MEVSSRCHGPATLLARKEFFVLSEQQASFDTLETKKKNVLPLPWIKSQSIPWLSSPYPTQNLKGTYILIHFNVVS